MGALFEKRGIRTVRDLLLYLPRAYLDLKASPSISALKEGEFYVIRAQLVKITRIPLGRTRKIAYELLVKDQTGQMRLKFFRLPYRGFIEQFSLQDVIEITGKLTVYRGHPEFHHPSVKVIRDPSDSIEDSERFLDAGKPGSSLVPIYTEIENLSSAKILKLIRLALDGVKESERDLIKKGLSFDMVPREILFGLNMPGMIDALTHLHCPIDDDGRVSELKNFSSPWHHRIIFDEFFFLELFLARNQKRMKQEQATPIYFDETLMKQFEESLPFPLTAGQKNAAREVLRDLSLGQPMNRLIQGDVGCGKTMVVFMALVAVSSVRLAKQRRKNSEQGQSLRALAQAAVMVPTEILAEQHYKNALLRLAPLGINMGLLTGRTKVKDREQILQQLKQGELDVLFGTHALIEDEVEFQHLSLVVIDEQHRFGVNQRSRLKKKGIYPHMLVLTATPIPRSLALTAYGDLDVSLIQDLPSGRMPIETRVARESKREAMMSFLSAQIQKGRQAYMIYPLVEESEKLELKDAISAVEKLRQDYPEMRFLLLHGKMKPEEKDAVMEQFKAGQGDVLVATTVVEVGVDVPNANIIVIEHAERFGLAQLHQLRGRVGRGVHKSFCILMLGQGVSDVAYERVSFLEKTTDGFKVSEFDLELRGPGEFMGTLQAGSGGFRYANLVRDQGLLIKAKEAAFELIRKDPELSKHPQLKTYLDGGLAEVLTSG